MKIQKIVLTTVSGITEFVDSTCSSVYLDIGENGEEPKYKFRILPDGRIFKVDKNFEEEELKEVHN